MSPGRATGPLARAAGFERRFDARGFLRLALAGLWLALALPVWADNLARVRSGALSGPASSGAITVLAVVGGRAVAFDGTAAWLAGEDAKTWQRVPLPLDAAPREAFGDGQRAYLLLGAGGPTQRLVQLGLDNGRLDARPLPPPAEALSGARAALLGSSIAMAGLGADGSLRLLQLDSSAPAAQWRSVSGGAGSLAPSSLVGQGQALYLTVPRPDVAAAEQLWSWSAAEGWRELGSVPGRVVPGSGRATGQAHVLYLVHAASPSGAAPRLMTYHTLTGSWATQAEIAPEAWSDSVRQVAPWANGLIWQRAASAAAPAGLGFAQIETDKLLLRPLDWVMIVAYLLGIASIGAYCYWREEKQSTAEFFVGSRTIPFWAAAVSLYVTATSSIGYIATTAKAFATNWQYLVNNLLGIVGLVFVAVWIVPMLRRLRLVSVFDYLEQRFHPSVRLMASAMCIVLHLGGRMSIILFLPSFAIATITGLDMTLSILLMGGVTIGYTALGGMRAVIWTDFVQLIVKVGGLVFALWFIASKLSGDFGQLVQTAAAADKLRMFDWSFDLTRATVWGFVFLVLMEVVLTFPKDQVLMQRVFTTKSDRDAGRSVWMYAAIIFPASCLFYLIGTGLWLYYKSHPERMNPLLAVDATFPLFIAAELPAGITGLMIAGIFASSMATCASIMNSVATMVSVDFYERLAAKATQAKSIRLAEWVTVAAGAVGIGLALLLSRYNIGSYLDVALDLYGLLGGGFAGAYTLGMFTRRANWQGVLIGMAASVILTFAAWWVNLVHPFIYLAIAILFSIVFGYLGSLFFPPPAPAALEGLIVQRG